MNIISTNNTLYQLPERLFMRKRNGRIQTRCVVLNGNVEEQYSKDIQDLDRFIVIYNHIRKQLGMGDVKLNKLCIRTLVQKEVLFMIMKILYNCFLLDKGSMKLIGSGTNKIPYHTGNFYHINGFEAVTTSIRDVHSALTNAINDYKITKATVLEIYALLRDLDVIQQNVVTEHCERGSGFRSKSYTVLTELGFLLLLSLFATEK